MPNPVPLGSPPASENDFKVYSSKPNVRFLTRGVQPPSTVYVYADDDIVVQCATGQQNESVTVSYRLLRFDGQIVLGQFQLRPASNRSVTMHQEDLAEGFLVSVSCKATVATTRGQTFVRIFLTNPSLGGGQPSYMLMADYVTTAMAPAHPNGRVLAPTEGPGVPSSIVVTAPAVGSDWLAVVPANARWKLRSWKSTLQASGAVANRYVTFSIISAFNNANQWGADKFQTAGVLTTYTGAPLAPNISPSPLIGMVGYPPDMQMLGLDSVGTTTIGLQAGDQWGNIVLGFEEWLDNV